MQVVAAAGVNEALRLMETRSKLSDQGVDIFYETFTVVSRRCTKLGM